MNRSNPTQSRQVSGQRRARSLYLCRWFPRGASGRLIHLARGRAWQPGYHLTPHGQRTARRRQAGGGWQTPFRHPRCIALSWSSTSRHGGSKVEPVGVQGEGQWPLRRQSWRTLWKLARRRSPTSHWRSADGETTGWLLDPLPSLSLLGLPLQPGVASNPNSENPARTGSGTVLGISR